MCALAHKRAKTSSRWTKEAPVFILKPVPQTQVHRAPGRALQPPDTPHAAQHQQLLQCTPQTGQEDTDKQHVTGMPFSAPANPATHSPCTLTPSTQQAGSGSPCLLLPAITGSHTLWGVSWHWFSTQRCDSHEDWFSTQQDASFCSHTAYTSPTQLGLMDHTGRRAP